MTCRVRQFKFTAQWGVSSRSPLLARQLQQFGANLRRERDRRNITQESLAAAADLNVRTLQRIETGETNVLLTTALRLQKAVDCSWEKLMPNS